MNFINIISELNILKKASIELESVKETTSKDEFAILLKKFEKEVDKLNVCLVEAFNNDPEIMQVIFELKSVVIALRGENVETTV
jgi:hypothetical protein